MMTMMMAPEQSTSSSSIGKTAMSPSSGGVKYDTTYTKIFVGGLAWETQCDTMRRHFEQYGDVLEAVVITDKTTGRSKGYGFVTFREAEAARRACADASPVIDGRRANCNLACLGAHKSRAPSFPLHGNRIRFMAPYPTSPAPMGGGSAYFVGAPVFTPPGQYAFQAGVPYQAYGSYALPYSQEYSYQPNMYNPYSGAAVASGPPPPASLPPPAPYPHLYAGTGAAGYGMYPYMQLSQSQVQQLIPSSKQVPPVNYMQSPMYGPSASSPISTSPSMYGGGGYIPVATYAPPTPTPSATGLTVVAYSSSSSSTALSSTSSPATAATNNSQIRSASPESTSPPQAAAAAASV